MNNCSTTQVKLRSGITTGTCASAAAQAAALCLNNVLVKQVMVKLPSGRLIAVEIESVHKTSKKSAIATVRKYAGDDPDVTDGALISTALELADQDEFRAGKGVGTITKAGLQFPPGEPAINPVPRKMMIDAIRSVSSSTMRITVSVKNGEELAKQTYNSRLGILNGISILGTTGIVRPYCHKAMCDAIAVSMKVANISHNTLFLTPGNIGVKGLNNNFSVVDTQLIEVGNEWAFPIDLLKKYSFKKVVIAGHPGKLAKIINDNWQTHSKDSGPANETVVSIAEKVLKRPFRPTNTVEGFFRNLSKNESIIFGREVASQIADKIKKRAETKLKVEVVLFNMSGEIIGQHGDISFE